MDNNKVLLDKMFAAFKNIVDVDTLGQAILQPEKFAQFVRAMQHKTVILNEARFIEMDSDVVDIDRVGFVGRILHSGTALVGDEWVHRKLDVDVEGEYAKPVFATNKLTAKELQAVTGLRDRALRRNIEKGNFENTLVDLFGEAAGRDMEEYAVLADKDILYSKDDVLSLTDGWAKWAKQKLYGVGVDKDFDPNPTGTTWPENMFQAMLEALPKQFLQNESEWRFLVDWDVRDAYQNLLKERKTSLGDLALIQTGEQVPPFKGISVRYVPVLGRSKTVVAGGNGRVALLSHPNNMAWGIFHEITVEPNRVALDRRTDFVLTFEGDAGYEDENAAVVAYLDKENPSS